MTNNQGADTGRSRRTTGAFPTKPKAETHMEAHARTSFPGKALWLLASLYACAALAGGCAVAPGPPGPSGPLLFPPPPHKARIQYLGAVSSSLDLPMKRGGFAEFIMGPPEVSHVLAKPIAVVLSGSDLYVCDTVLNTVVVYSFENGGAHRLRGDKGLGKILQPNNISLDAEGRIYVSDALRGAVLVYGPDEEYLHAWGRPDEATPVAAIRSGDVLYVSDIKDHEIEVWDATTGEFLRAIGGAGREAGRFAKPTHLALDDQGNLYVADTANFRVQKFSPEGEYLREIGGLGDAPGKFSWPKGVGIDGRGRLYVVDSRFANVQIFDAEGRLLFYFGGPGPNRGNLNLPAGVWVGPWPALGWFEKRLLPGFEPEYLVIVVNQWRGNFINFFAVAREDPLVPDSGQGAP